MPRTPSTARKATAAKAAAAKTSPAKPAGAAAVADAVTSIQSAQARRAGHPSAQPAAPGSPVGAFIEVALDVIDESPDNPRSVLPELPALAKSIEAVGVIEPIVVVQDGDRFRIVAGHRRVAASKLAGLKSVPAILRTDDAVAEHIHRMVENLQRVDLNPLEEARGYARLKDLGVKQKAIAEAVGRNQGHVSKRLALLNLPPEIAARVGRDDAGGVTLEQAVDIARLNGRVQIAIAEASHAADDAKFRGGYDLDTLIRREASIAERASELVDVVKALRSAKVTVLNLTGDEISEPPSPSAVDGPAPLAWLHDLDRDAHAKLPCHAVTIRRSPVGGESLLERWTQEVCTDPGSHAGASAAARAARPTETVGSALADPAAAAERAAKVEAVNDAKAHLAGWVGDAVAGKIVREMAAYVQRGQIRDALLGREYYLANTADAMALLGRTESTDLVELLRFGVSGQAGDKLTRAALAARLDADVDAVESFIRDHAFGYELDVRYVVDALAFYGFARPLGYEPSELELGALAAIEDRGVDGWLRDALLEGNLLEEDDDEPAAAGEPEGPSNRERQLARGVTEDCLARAERDGVPDTVALEPGRAIPTGRCTVCGGPAKALTMGAAGRHAPGGGSVRKGHPACEGKELVSLDAAEAAAAPDAQVACPDCSAVGRDADDGICTRCAGSGLVPAPAEEAPVAAAG